MMPAASNSEWSDRLDIWKGVKDYDRLRGKYFLINNDVYSVVNDS